MADDPTDRLIDDIIRREGRKFTHDPDDPGGPTRFGITLRTLRSWRKNNRLTAADVRTLKEPEAREILAHKYIVRPGFDQVGSGPLYELLVDSGVNHGVGRAAKWFQRAVGASADGVIGPRTMAAYRSLLARDPGGRPTAVYLNVLNTRNLFYYRILKRDPSQLKYAGGWSRRVGEFILKVGEL